MAANSFVGIGDKGYSAETRHKISLPTFFLKKANTPKVKAVNSLPVSEDKINSAETRHKISLPTFFLKKVGDDSMIQGYP